MLCFQSKYLEKLEKKPIPFLSCRQPHCCLGQLSFSDAEAVMLGTLSCMRLAEINLSIVLHSSDAAEQSCRAEHPECHLGGVGHHKQRAVEQQGGCTAAHAPQPDQLSSLLSGCTVCLLYPTPHPFQVCMRDCS